MREKMNRKPGMISEMSGVPAGSGHSRKCSASEEKSEEAERRIEEMEAEEARCNEEIKALRDAVERQLTKNEILRKSLESLGNGITEMKLKAESLEENLPQRMQRCSEVRKKSCVLQARSRRKSLQKNR